VIDGVEDAAIAEWSRGLSGLTPEQIRRGIDGWESEWPPTLPEFRRACLGKSINGHGLDYTPEVYRPSRPDRTLTHGTDSYTREQKREMIRKLRESFNA